MVKLNMPVMVLVLLSSMGSAVAQRPTFWPDNVRSEMVQTETLKMQIYRAGESGMPIVIMQDMHDYFDPAPKWNKQINRVYHRNCMVTGLALKV